MKNIHESKKDFLTHCCYEKNLSDKTLKSYSIDLAQFIAYLIGGQYPLDVVDIDKTVIREYLQSISSFKPKTIKRKIATIKALFNFLEFEDKLVVNPFRKLRIQIREPYRLPKVMNIQEIESIIRSAYNMKVPGKKVIGRRYLERIQDIAVIELLFATGIRVSELSQLRNESINLSTGLLRVRGKGDKERIITICNTECLKAVREYNTYFHQHGSGNEAYFLVNRLKKRLSEQSIRFIVKKHARLAGLERNITPHVFRHSFATLLVINLYKCHQDEKYYQSSAGLFQ
jgi:integrase/recombinase XerD